MDFSKLLSDDPDALGEIQRLTQGGNFDPLAMFQGQARFHAVFIAPFTPALAKAVTQFLTDGSGALAGVARMFQGQGASAAEALVSAQEMFRAAHGMCVVVLANDQGLDTVPQLFFGHLEEAYRDQVVRLCGDDFKDAVPLRAALADLAAKATAGAAGPALISVPGKAGAAAARVGWEVWLDLARRLAASLDAGVPSGSGERLRDLAWWVGTAVGALATSGAPPQPVGHSRGVAPLAPSFRGASPPVPPGTRIDGATAAAVARSLLLCGEVASALPLIDVALQGELDDEARVQLIHAAVDAACTAQHPALAGDWLRAHIAAADHELFASYDALLALFRVQAAAQLGADALLDTAARLAKANRKAVRHDLTREPLWRVCVAEPGELLDTAAAGELVGRSPTFVAKRLESGTIPWLRQGDQVRLPRAALVAWKAVMDAHKLLD